MPAKLNLLISSVLSFAIAGCGQRELSLGTEGSPPARPAAKLLPAEQPQSDPEGLHNLLRVSEQIYSGSEPHGEVGFESLRQLGAKTIVSVDGAKPNVELAHQYGLRYVHIPIGYDGISQAAGETLARLVNDAHGPFYIHCHHGRHRGPAAAAVACIASGEVEAKDALQILERAGTSKGYAGLWRDVANYKPPAKDAQLPELVEVAEVSSFAAAMAQVDRSYDNLKRCRDADWATPQDHPDIVPSQQALLLQEGLHEAGRAAGDRFDDAFKAWLAEAESEASAILTDLKNGRGASAAEKFTTLELSCTRCHQTYRDR